MKRILVGLSGGVDSAVSAYLLKKQGYDVTAGFMINYLAPEGEYCPTKEDIEVARQVAEYLEIPFFTFDYREEYEKKVLNYMYEGYKKGITPNPDIMCNSEVKFKVFLEEALELGFDGVATGHYARITTSSQPSPLEDKEQAQNNSPLLQRRGVRGEVIYHLKKGVDENKDQSYFLAGLNQFQLSHSLFPIGDLEKPEVRKIAEEIGLPNAKRKDSQGICFVGKVDMAKFLEKKIKPKKGLVKDTSGKVLGEHKGVFYYTIGQRKGLDIGGQAEPIFVVKKDLDKNEIIVGTEKDLNLYSDELEFYSIHVVCPHPNPLPIKDMEQKQVLPLTRGELEGGYILPLKAKCKIRYRQADQDCMLYQENGVYKVKFEKPQRAIASGQICAIYLGDDLVISGVIK
ncbi:MAG: tRNA 2-thiouridine(34) synthase MnmA [Candidatus Gracilibacteria bacterium]|nr:tRNA 2-thiouridine(34) synthase MnmA [Candidatus Gracilibacteria bacterium]